MSIDHKAWLGFGSINNDFYNTLAEVFNSYPIQKGQDNCVRKQCIVALKIVTNISDVRRDLMALKAFEVAFFIAADSLNFRKI
ncbi:hypothetical protein D3C84_1111130 [compost metagenome]